MPAPLGLGPRSFTVQALILGLSTRSVIMLKGGRSSAFSFLKMVQDVLHTYFENIQKMSQLVAEFAAKVSFKSGCAFLKPYLPGIDHVAFGASQLLSDGSVMTLPLFLFFSPFLLILLFPEKFRACRCVAECALN